MAPASPIRLSGMLAKVKGKRRMDFGDKHKKITYNAVVYCCILFPNKPHVKIVRERQCCKVCDYNTELNNEGIVSTLFCVVCTNMHLVDK